ncbi:MAG TPA: phenylalanine--tRNA ligase subunit alpha, partial [Chitinophagaceae bacterium]|nr:phenylalanine--tRNA ligase subunit alpha [Chitinophagaceae bacterium]
MDELLKQIENYKSEIETYTAADDKAVEEFRIKWLGTKGLVKHLMSDMKNVPNEKKKEFGQIL